MLFQKGVPPHQVRSQDREVGYPHPLSPWPGQIPGWGVGYPHPSQVRSQGGWGTPSPCPLPRPGMIPGRGGGGTPQPSQIPGWGVPTPPPPPPADVDRQTPVKTVPSLVLRTRAVINIKKTLVYPSKFSDNSARTDTTDLKKSLIFVQRNFCRTLIKTHITSNHVYVTVCAVHVLLYYILEIYRGITITAAVLLDRTQFRVQPSHIDFYVLKSHLWLPLLLYCFVCLLSRINAMCTER